MGEYKRPSTRSRDRVASIAGSIGLRVCAAAVYELQQVQPTLTGGCCHVPRVVVSEGAATYACVGSVPSVVVSEGAATYAASVDSGRSVVVGEGAAT